MDSTERLGIIIKAIGNNPGITLNGLVQKLKAANISFCEKTIANDIDFLKKGLKLLPDKARLRSGYSLLGLQTLGEDESGIVIDALTAFGVNLNDSRAQEISRRLAANLAPGLRSTGIRQRNIYKSSAGDEGVEQALLDAIRTGAAVRMTLNSPRSTKPLKLTSYPLFRIFHERGWYLITKDLATGAYFPSRIDRIESCEILTRHEPNSSAGSDIIEAQYLMNCGWGMDFPHSKTELEETERLPNIVVRFDPTVADFIREGVFRHPKALIAPAPDGSGAVDFKIKLKYHGEFKRWVRSWGSKAWFVEPQAFRDEEIAETRRRMLIYGVDG